MLLERLPMNRLAVGRLSERVSAAGLMPYWASSNHRLSRCSQLVKNRFDKLLDGEAGSPATAILSSFCLNPADSGCNTCKETFFLWKIGFSAAKVLPSPPFNPPGTMVVREGSGPLELSKGFSTV